MLNKRFITFEGGEGSGKSTQIRLFKKKLSKIGNVILTREPGGTKESELIRKILVKGKETKFSDEVEILLLYAARKDHLNKVIIPNLKKKNYVLCDRYIDSTFAYQAKGKRSNLKLIRLLNKSITGNFLPSLTFYLDIDPSKGIRRSKRSSNKELRFENMPLSYHRQIRQNFLKLSKKHKRIVKIDASLSKKEIGDTIWKVFNKTKI
ncbi:MAG: dTMP kinase [Pelagibacteraceae bacterium]|nr:dTMP kinase [Pelagibacteraceae bacterium]